MEKLLSAILSELREINAKTQIKQEILTVSDVSEFLHCGRNTTLGLFTHNDFPGVKVGRQYIVHIEDLTEWIRKNKGRKF